MFKIILAIFIFTAGLSSQLLNVPLIISDGGLNGTDTLYFGIDPAGSDSIDIFLGEYQLPPMPPAGIFDCRFIGGDLVPPLQFGQGLNRDYRQGSESFAGSKLHEMQFQKGSGSLINIHWVLPNGVTGRLYDLFGGVIVNDSMYGNGSINITNNGINKLFLRVNYASGSIGIKNISQTIPVEFTLFQNYPNPFNPITRIRFNIPQQESVKLTVYNAAGKTIAVLVNMNLRPGVYEIGWDASLTASGIYYYRMETDNFSETKKMIVLK